ncbi:MAG: alpha/beta hydrolase [Verrucomicrobiota bacterium JB022]|nr:alpha/beta hydrolase [Verrucomicrobiota bacterium JB022]
MNLDFKAPEFSRTLELPDGQVVGYAEIGLREGKPVLFMHGWPSCRLQPLHAYELVNRYGVRLIVPDRPGLGLSSPVPERRIADYPAQMAALLDHLQIGRCHVMGESGGCPYALATAWALPERVDKVAVLCGAPPLSEFDDWSDLFPVFRLLLSIRQRAPGLQLQALKLATLYTRWMPERWMVKAILPVLPSRDRQAMQEPQALPAYTAMAHGTYGNGPAPVLQDGELFLADWGFPWREIRRPVAFWHGCDDQTLPLAKTRWLAEQIPGASFFPVEGEGHYSLPVYHFETALRWLYQKTESTAENSRQIQAI